MHLLFLLLSCRQQTDGLRNLLCLFPTYFTRHKSNADIYFQFCIIRQDTNRIQLWYFCIGPGMVIQFLRIQIPDIRYPCFSRIRSINRGIDPRRKETTALRRINGLIILLFWNFTRVGFKFIKPYIPNQSILFINIKRRIKVAGNDCPDIRSLTF